MIKHTVQESPKDSTVSSYGIDILDAEIKCEKYLNAVYGEYSTVIIGNGEHVMCNRFIFKYIFSNSI